MHVGNSGSQHMYCIHKKVAYRTKLAVVMKGKSHGHTKGLSCGFVLGSVIPLAEEQSETSAGEIECCSLTGDI